MPGVLEWDYMHPAVWRVTNLCASNGLYHHGLDCGTSTWRAGKGLRLHFFSQLLVTWSDDQPLSGLIPTQQTLLFSSPIVSHAFFCFGPHSLATMLQGLGPKVLSHGAIFLPLKMDCFVFFFKLISNAFLVLFCFVVFFSWKQNCQKKGGKISCISICLN